MSVARFLIEDMGHFQHFEGRDLHAHMQTLGDTAACLGIGTPSCLKISFARLSAGQIIDILDLTR
jgi:hypothetical protein